MSSMSKRGTTNGFDEVRGEKTAKRLKYFQKNQPAGKWRHIKRVKVEK